MGKEKIRINKYLAQAAGISKRKADAAILEGRVSLNERIIFVPGTLVDPEKERIRLDGKLISFIDEKVYILLNKPRGVLTTMADPRGRKTVADIVDNVYPRVFPVGRLDYNTSGLLILTNDGELSNLLTHPRYEIEKVYLAKVKGVPSKSKLGLLRKGIEIDGRRTAPGFFSLSEVRKDKAWIVVKISEGRYRQIRKMFAKVGHPVLNLRRIGFASLILQDMPPGAWRYLTKREITSLRKYVAEKMGEDRPQQGPGDARPGVVRNEP